MNKILEELSEDLEWESKHKEEKIQAYKEIFSDSDFQLLLAEEIERRVNVEISKVQRILSISMLKRGIKMLEYGTEEKKKENGRNGFINYTDTFAFMPTTLANMVSEAIPKNFKENIHSDAEYVRLWDEYSDKIDEYNNAKRKGT